MPTEKYMGMQTDKRQKNSIVLLKELSVMSKKVDEAATLKTKINHHERNPPNTTHKFNGKVHQLNYNITI